MNPIPRIIFFYFLLSISSQACALLDNTNLGVITENIRGIPIQFFDDGSAYSPSSPDRIATTEKILKEAFNLSGVPYRAGGSSPDTGFDCSGFVRYVFNQSANISLPATARAIAKLGKTINKTELQKGDLVFFNTLNSPESHVAIYIGDNQFIHAPSSGGAVRTDQIDSAYWSKHFNSAKRIAID